MSRRPGPQLSMGLPAYCSKPAIQKTLLRRCRYYETMKQELAWAERLMRTIGRILGLWNVMSRSSNIPMSRCWRADIGPNGQYLGPHVQCRPFVQGIA